MCPKCRQHAQITETGKQTLKCQRCGAFLKTRKLRVLYSSEKLEDAVLFRTHLQTQISEKGNETFSLTSPSKESEHLYPETESLVSKFKLPQKSSSKILSSKKDPKSILLEILKSTGGKIEQNELKQKALEKGVTQDKFEITLRTLLEIGELYAPKPGIIKIV